MYSRLQSLSEEAVTNLLDLKEGVKFSEATGSRRRVGKNTTQALSTYNYSKWFTWTHAQREVFRTATPVKQTSRAKQVWFLDIPAGNGFLDVMTYWVGTEKNCGKVCAYALRDQIIRIGGKDIPVEKGEGIYFCLSEIHSIAPSKDGQLWACIMSQYPVEALV